MFLKNLKYNACLPCEPVYPLQEMASNKLKIYTSHTFFRPLNFYQVIVPRELKRN